MANQEDELVEADKELVRWSIYKKLDELEPPRLEPSTIHKVRRKIRYEEPEAYDPQTISIGPFHHGIPKLLPMEPLKRQFLRHLIRRHESNMLSTYIGKLGSASSVADARSCYSEEVVRVDDVDTFVEMLVCDGCFIIEFFVKSLLGEDLGELDFVKWDRSLVERDLLLLENQIPFFVLESLFASTVIPGLTDTERPVTLKELASRCISRDTQNSAWPIPRVVHHLLHLRQSSLAPTPRDSLVPRRRVTHQVISFFRHIFLYFITPKLPGCLRPPLPELNQRAPRRMPRASELHESGVKFQIKKNPGCILDVDFSLKEGIMEIPRVSVQPVKMSLFKNLIAFEQCYPAAGNHLTAYAVLMENLIVEPWDVALLQRSGVLERKVGGFSEKWELYRFFNELGKGGHLNYERHYLRALFKDVNEYCGTRTPKQMRVVHGYHSNS